MKCQNCKKEFDKCDTDTNYKGFIVFICPYCKHGNYNDGRDSFI